MSRVNGRCGRRQKGCILEAIYLAPRPTLLATEGFSARKKPSMSDPAVKIKAEDCAAPLREEIRATVERLKGVLPAIQPIESIFWSSARAAARKSRCYCAAARGLLALCRFQPAACRMTNPPSHLRRPGPSCGLARDARPDASRRLVSLPQGRRVCQCPHQFAARHPNHSPNLML